MLRGLTFPAALQQLNPVMDFKHLMGRYLRLRQKLARAYQEQAWDSEQIDLLADQIVATEREIALLKMADEHFGDTESGFVYHSGDEA
jgi:hypothetical protein